jgi:3-oxoacyl-[acyl-carrier protein] reductase
MILLKVPLRNKCNNKFKNQEKMNKKLEKKVVIVTGASKGIGAGIAKQMAAEGAKVVVNYVSSKESADLAVAEITSMGGTAIAVQGDISKSEDVKKLFEETKKYLAV